MGEGTAEVMIEPIRNVWETKFGKGTANKRVVLGRGSWSPRSTPLPPQQSKVSKSGAAPGFAAVPPQNVAVTSPIPIPNPAQVSLSVASIVEGLSHGHVSRVTGASSSTGNAPSVQPSTTEVSKVSSTSQTPPASPPTSATRSTPPLKTPSVSPTTVVNKVAPPLKTRSISPSAHAVSKLVPVLSNAATPPQLLKLIHLLQR